MFFNRRSLEASKPRDRGRPPGRAGQGVAVLLKIYARCIDGQADAANRRISDALGGRDAEPEPRDEEDGDSEQASWKMAGQRLEEPGRGVKAQAPRTPSVDTRT